MRRLSLIDETVGLVFPVPVCAQKYVAVKTLTEKNPLPNRKAPLPNFANLPAGWEPNALLAGAPNHVTKPGSII